MSVTDSFPLASGLLHVGVNVENRYFHGSIDDIRIYDRALSAEEIRLLYQAEAELPEQSVTSAKLSPALSDLIDGNRIARAGTACGFSDCPQVRRSSAAPTTPFFNALNTTRH